MKVQCIFPGSTALIVITQLFFACTKPALETDIRDGNNIYKNCRVNQVSGSYSGARQFSYNSNNDPLSGTVAAPATGNPNFIFRYNSQGGLVEYTGMYTGNTSFEFMHRYGYQQNRITTDTMYVFGSSSNPPSSYSKRIKYLQYDRLNRIETDSEVYIYPYSAVTVFRYEYNADGNLVNNSYAGYDSKMNPHRTNRVWMFIDRDYSLNNAVAATAYNSNGLPLSITLNTKTNEKFMFGYGYYNGTVTIAYDCRN